MKFIIVVRIKIWFTTNFIRFLYVWATLQFEASKSNSLRWLDTITLLFVPYSVSDDKVLHFKLEILSVTTTLLEKFSTKEIKKKRKIHPPSSSIKSFSYKNSQKLFDNRICVSYIYIYNNERILVQFVPVRLIEYKNSWDFYIRQREQSISPVKGNTSLLLNR